MMSGIPKMSSETERFLETVLSAPTTKRNNCLIYVADFPSQVLVPLYFCVLRHQDILFPKYRNICQVLFIDAHVHDCDIRAIANQRACQSIWPHSSRILTVVNVRSTSLRSRGHTCFVVPNVFWVLLCHGVICTLFVPVKWSRWQCSAHIRSLSYTACTRVKQFRRVFDGMCSWSAFAMHR